jgi:hypothetical protein
MHADLVHHPVITPSPEPLCGYIEPLLRVDGRWRETDEQDREARGLFARHASSIGGAKRRLSRLTGQLTLVTHQGDALAVFRRAFNRSLGKHAIDVVAFRNEGHFRSASLLREAIELWVRPRWSAEPLIACVHGQRLVATNPGYPFRLTGFRRLPVETDNRILLMLPAAAA